MGIKYKIFAIKIKCLSLFSLLAFSVNAQVLNVNSEPVFTNKTYKIALILPFKSNKSLSKLSEAYIDYYLGFTMGLQNVAKEGFKANFQVFDNAKDSLAIVQILNHPDMKNMDIIVGPLNEDLVLVERFCDSLNKILVSPLTYYVPRYKTKLINFTTNDLENWRAVIAQGLKKYPKRKVVILTDASRASYSATTYIKSALLDKRVPVYKEIGFANSTLDFSSLPNDSLLFIIASKDLEIPKVLNKAMILMTTSAAIANIDYHKNKKSVVSLPKLIVSTNENKANDTLCSKFKTDFKIKYVGESSKYGYTGFDHAQMLAYSLMAYGTNFLNYLPEATYTGINKRTKLVKGVDGSFVNHGLYYFKYYNGYTSLIE